MKCKKCKYYYRTMASGKGYNPAPYCHYYEETGKRPNILTQECFCKRAANNRPQIKENYLGGNYYGKQNERS